MKWLVIGALASAAALASYRGIVRLGLRLYYTPVTLSESQIQRDVSYVDGSTDPQQRLNLFLPTTKDFPVVIFIHGGNWDSGSKDYEYFGADVYNNIGRFLASKGFGAAVISYRLIPTVDWRMQADDVLHAVAWVHAHAAEFGGRPDQLVVMGHSAGAQLALRAALSQKSLEALGVPPGSIKGLIAVAGAGYDMTDAETYALGSDPEWYAKRFRLDADDANWQREASPIDLVAAGAPRTLIMHAGGEDKPLKRQSQLLQQRLEAAGTAMTFVIAPGLSHTRIVPTLSRADKPAGAALLDFLRPLL